MPQKFQHFNGKFDVIICLEERVYDQVGFVFYIDIKNYWIVMNDGIILEFRTLFAVKSEVDLGGWITFIV